MSKVKAALFILILFHLCLLAKAQKIDTIIYNGCIEKNDTTAYISDASVLDSCPKFRNGFSDLNKYIAAHIRYKSIFKRPDKETTVFVETVIEKDGSLSHTRVPRHITEELDKEAMRVVNSLPRWTPGVLNGKKVRVRYWVVVSFDPKKTYKQESPH